MFMLVDYGRASIHPYAAIFDGLLPGVGI